MSEEIVVRNSFYCQSHESSGKEEPEGVLEGKGELFIWGMLVPLKICEMVKGPPHDKLVEEDNENEQEEDQEHSKVVLAFIMQPFLGGAVLNGVE